MSGLLAGGGKGDAAERVEHADAVVEGGNGGSVLDPGGVVGCIKSKLQTPR